MSFEPYVAYEASAGSGKTFTLSVRYASLLFLGVKPEKIVVLTFTNKAANEMRIRIVELLYSLEKKEAELGEICAVLALQKEEILNKKEQVLQKFLKSEHKIMTIDSFLNLIVRNFSLYAGLPVDFKISKIDDFLLQKNFLKEIKKENLWQELLWLAIGEKKRINDIFDILKFMYEKDTELAGKGIIKDKIKSEEIKKELFLTFKKLQALVQSSEQASEKVVKMVEFSDIEDICKKTWLDRDSLKYDRSLFNKIYTDEMNGLFLKAKEFLKEYFNTLEKEILSNLLRLYSVYKKTATNTKISKAKLDFVDLTNIAAMLLKGIDANFLYFRLDGKIEHLLVDEFQDTSIAQYKILEPIIEEIRSGLGTGDSLKSFFYVGDIKQSIYRFRGGNSDLFEFVMDKYQIKQEFLKTNYRSSKSVVDFVNKTFKNIIPKYQEQLTREDAPLGSVDIVENEEINIALVDEIKRLRKSNIPFEEIAILVFTNDAIIDTKELLQREFLGVPIITDSSKRLVYQNDVKALIELLKHLYFEEEIYLKNFCALSKISKKPNTNYYKALFVLPFAKLLHLLIKDFELFKDDANLLKFLEAAKAFKDIEEFIYSYEFLDEPMIKGSHEGLKILTIHKSKGLEFSRVIVLDRSGRENNRYDSLIFNYDKIELKSINYRFSNRQKVDANYNQILEKEEKLQEKDKINTLYVAFTRAKNSLSVIKKPKNSAFDILNLAPQNIGKLETNNISKNKSYSKENINYKELFYGRQKLEIKKPKKLEDFNFEAVDIGLGFHYALEIISGFETENIEKAIMAIKNRFAMDEASYEKIKTMLNTLLNNEKFKTLTSGEIYKERAFIIDDEIGIIDLYVIDGKNIRVIDYKTGLKHKEYDIQIKKYINVLKEFYPDKNISGFLCYVEASKVEIKEVFN